MQRQLWTAATIGFWTLFTTTGCAHQPVSEIPAIHSEVRGEQDPTIVFINGNAASLGVWNEIEEAMFELGYRTFRSDREGTGNSVLGARPYEIENEVQALQTALGESQIAGDKLIVAHSYGGLIAARLAQSDATVIGVVLVDAMLPTEMTEAYNTSILEQYRPQYQALRDQAPDLAEAVIPIVEGFPETAGTLADLEWPTELPVVTIRAARAEDPEVRQRISANAHDAFVAKDPLYRRKVRAENSGHQVMRDEPDLVITTIRSLIEED